jgi:hypothetical protein
MEEVIRIFCPCSVVFSAGEGQQLFKDRGVDYAGNPDRRVI